MNKFKKNSFFPSVKKSAGMSSSEASERHSSDRKAIACRVLFLFLCMFLCSCEKKTPETMEFVYPVAAATAYREQVFQTLEFTGRVIPLKSLSLVARVDGFLTKRNFSEGSYVSEGAVLYEIEPYSYEYSVLSADAELKKAEANELNAKLEFDRTNKLFQENVYPAETFDSARASYQTATAQKLAADAALKQARLNQSYTTIRAPFSGWIGLAALDVGNYISAPSKPLATLLYIDQVRVEVNVSDTDLKGSLLHSLPRGEKPDWPVTVVLPDGKTRLENGSIAFWDNRIHDSTATLRIQALFENTERILLPGMFVRTLLKNPSGEDAVLIDHRTLSHREGSDFVMVIDSEERLVYRQVELGPEHGNATVVRKGLYPGERVVLSGNPMLRPGSKVRVIPADKKP